MENGKKKDSIKRLFDNAFKTDLEWNDWFFENVYKDEEALVYEKDGAAVSSLFLQRYKFNLHGQEMDFGYIAGATTEYKYRHEGYMSELLSQALTASYERGDALAGLIPATRRLFFFYDKFQFSTVVYADIERYSALHSFPMTEEYSITEPTFEAFTKLERQRAATIQHTEKNFNDIIYDIKHDQGTVVQINGTTGIPLALAFATANEDEIHVKELAGADTKATDMALGYIKSFFEGEKPMVVWREPTGPSTSLRAKGMIRLVNPLKILSALANNHKDINQKIRITDKYISENNGDYILKDGTCTKAEWKLKNVNLDVTVDVLAKIIFNNPKVGEIFGIPSCRPIMNLMLD